MNELVALSNELLFASIDPALPAEEQDAAAAAQREIADAAFASALGNFRRGTAKFVSLSNRLLGATAEFGGGSGRLDPLFSRVARLQAEFHDQEGMRTTWANAEEFEEDARDEIVVAPSDVQITIPGVPAGLTRLTGFDPVNARDFASLETEYLQFFLSADWRSADDQRAAKKFARAAAENKPLYEAVVTGSTIPWWFVAGIHLLESTFNFGTHLHNGDPLSRRTFRVPASRPEVGNPPFNWADSAHDAMEMKGYLSNANWSLARVLHRWEAYNGFGYRSRNVPTPYLWSFTTVYKRGKFVGDGVYNTNAVSQQCGAAAFLKALIETGAVAEVPGVEVFVEPPAEAAETAGVPVANLAAAAADKDAATIHIDGTVATNPDFQQFFAENLPEIKHFDWKEFLVKGGSHKGNQLNTDPPREKWPNVIPLVRVLEALRQRLGHPIVLTSVYRSPAYNAAIGGASSSQHTEFRAADFVVPGHGSPADWHAELHRMRVTEGLFSGGLGLYQDFVHIDIRGYNADW